MKDDEYNRLFRKDDDRSWWLWIAVGLIAIAATLFLLLPAQARDRPTWVKPYIDEQCAASYACNRDVIWELVYQDEVISDKDLTEEECELLRESLEPQTEAFAYLTCRPRLVEREES